MGNACAKGQRDELPRPVWPYCNVEGVGRGGQDGKAKTLQSPRAKLKLLNLSLEAVESHGGTLSGFVIQKSLAEQDSLQGAIRGLCIIQGRNEWDVTEAMVMERGNGVGGGIGEI